MPGPPVHPWDRITHVDEYEVVAADLAHACDDAAAVWGNTIGWPGRQAEVYRRYYLECPVAQPELWLLRHVPSRQVVGTLGIGPRRVSWGGRELRVGVLSHFCVTRPHRRVKPPVLLAKTVVDACRGRYDLLYAMPRTPRAAALGKLFGGPPACHVSRRVKVLRHSKYLARMLPAPLARVGGAILDAPTDARRGWRRNALTATWCGEASAEMAALWAASPPGEEWRAARDLDTLRWRFDRLPARRRRYLLVHARAGGPLAAWFACDTNYFDPDILVVQDYWAEGGASAVTRTAIRVLCRAARALGFAAVELQLAAPRATAQAWINEGFVERNRHPVLLTWLTQPAAAAGGFHITAFDDDG